MAYRWTALGELVRQKPSMARERILEAYRELGGDVAKVAEKFGVKAVTLYRWMRELKMEEAREDAKVQLAIDAVEGT